MDQPVALLFDVFGTVVDWRSAVISEGRAIAPELDWGRLADVWRGHYAPTLRRVVAGELPWAPLDELQRQMLDTTLTELGIGGLAETQRATLSRVWERLDPWPDVPASLARIKERHIICPLSNGSMRELVGIARRGHLPWDAIFSTELFHTFKPDPRTYLGAAQLLQLAPAQVMMVAAHPLDLRAAAALGLQTALVPRPLEWGPAMKVEPSAPGEFTMQAATFVELADQLASGR
ncbi:MAG TPA: haloacid dehalogenase type II [Chloroflexota bacterium]|nr:haloacid dehalogenase type II [Chloroflexota bacterium]